MLDDHAFVAQGLLELYESDPNPKWLTSARALMDAMIAEFGDPDGGGFFFSEPGASDLLVRQKSFSDGAEPSGAAVATLVLQKLRSYGVESATLDLLDSSVRAGGSSLASQPGSHSVLLRVMDANIRPSMEVVLASDEGQETELEPFLLRYNKQWRPYSVLARVNPDTLEKLSGFGGLSGKFPGEDGVRAYVCFDGVCKMPTSDPEEFSRQMQQVPE